MSADPYREWDAAYVMGALSPSERQEYEQHRSTCPECAADVAELAGLPGILAAVPGDQAMALLADDVGRGPEPAQRELLANVLELAHRRQQRDRWRRAVLALGAAAVAACIAVVAFRLAPGPATTADRGELVSMSQLVASPVTAEARLIPEAWGTTIEVTCRYAESATGDGPERYTLYLTDATGAEIQQASWTATPGSVTMPTATTSLTVEEIAGIEIRWEPLGLVVLGAEL